MTNWQKIYKTLKDAGLNPFPVGVHRGECLNKYVVIREGAQIGQLGASVGKQRIEIMVFVPVMKYIELEPYKKAIIKELNQLEFLRKTGYESEAITDPDRLATFTILEYYIDKRIGAC